VDELCRARKAAHVPVLIGSGMTPENIPTYYPLADGFIVGSTFRQDARFLGALDPKRLGEFMAVLRGLKVA
jgi:predicted TIM-barrel enzyme